MRLSFILHPSPFILVASATLFLIAPNFASAAPASITFRYKHHLFTLAPKDFPEWKVESEQWESNGEPIVAPQGLRVDGDVLPPIPSGLNRSKSVIWNRAAIEADLQKLIVTPLSHAPGVVTISKNEKGTIAFDGVGLPGRTIDGDVLADLAVEALERDITDVEIPVTETQPHVTVTDPDLVAQGIKEVVTVGQSDFSNSPAARRHNIATGMAKFNGHLIAKDEVFSFDKVLGRVDDSTGYWKELVIKGERTEPDFGGGLCQVSTTAYRGVWEYGFPILDRRNHSFAVSHYAPQGTDATVYPGSADMKFKNDSPGSILIQTAVEGDQAYFIYYGTRDNRVSEIFGPYIWDRTPPPGDRTEQTTEIPAGTKKKVGDRVPGMKAEWYRVTKVADAPEKVEEVFSSYEARPLYYLIGVASVPGEAVDTGATTLAE